MAGIINWCPCPKIHPLSCPLLPCITLVHVWENAWKCLEKCLTCSQMLEMEMHGKWFDGKDAEALHRQSRWLTNRPHEAPETSQSSSQAVARHPWFSFGKVFTTKPLVYMFQAWCSLASPCPKIHFSLLLPTVTCVTLIHVWEDP